MNIFSEIKKLRFPVDQYIIVGSGIMGALGMKECHDIDVVVTSKLFEQLRKTGEWREWQRPGDQGIRLDKNGVELFLHVNCGKIRPTFDDLKRGEVIIQDIPFISLEQLLAFKRAYHRPKDAADIAIIEEYLRQSKSPQ